MAAQAKELPARISLKCGYSVHLLELSRSRAVPAPERKQDEKRKREGFVVIVVHGGPGLSDHTESLAGLRRLVEDDDDDDYDDDGRVIESVAFYDQLGCGESDKPGDPERYTLDRYVDELREVVEHISSRRRSSRGANVCLLGHSWGGQLTLELLLGSAVPAAVRCAVVSNAPLNETTYESKQRMLRERLDAATREFYRAEEREKARDGSLQSMIYRKLIGTRETEITGEMRGWSVLDRLGDPAVPCLFVTGDDDTVPFEEYEAIGEKESSSAHQSLILDGGGHGPFFGGTVGEYFAAIRRFLRDCRNLGQEEN